MAYRIHTKMHLKTYKRRWRCNSEHQLKAMLAKLRKQGLRYRVRGRYTPVHFIEQREHYYRLANMFRLAEKKRGCDHDKTRMGCGCNPTFWDAFEKKYPDAYVSYYNDIVRRDAEKCRRSGFPVDYWDIYIY